MILATESDTKQLGARIGRLVRGGEMIELIGDVGAGKTTFTKGLGEGLRVDDDVQSPTFTISREYKARDGLELHHYDFYRLSDPGVVSYELAESVANPHAITVVEWGETTRDVLPAHRVVVQLRHGVDESRECEVNIPDVYSYIREALV